MATTSLCSRCNIWPQNNRTGVRKGLCCNRCPDHGVWCTQFAKASGDTDYRGKLAPPPKPQYNADVHPRSSPTSFESDMHLSKKNESSSRSVLPKATMTKDGDRSEPVSKVADQALISNETLAPPLTSRRKKQSIHDDAFVGAKADVSGNDGHPAGEKTEVLDGDRSDLVSKAADQAPRLSEAFAPPLTNRTKKQCSDDDSSVGAKMEVSEKVGPEPFLVSAEQVRGSNGFHPPSSCEKDKKIILCNRCNEFPRNQRTGVRFGLCCNKCPDHGVWCTKHSAEAEGLDGDRSEPVSKVAGQALRSSEALAPPLARSTKKQRIEDYVSVGAKMDVAEKDGHSVVEKTGGSDGNRSEPLSKAADQAPRSSETLAPPLTSRTKKQRIDDDPSVGAKMEVSEKDWPESYLVSAEQARGSKGFHPPLCVPKKMNKRGLKDVAFDKSQPYPLESPTVAIPTLEVESSAFCTGKPMPAASLDEFFRFLGCQLHIELRQHTGEVLDCIGDGAKKILADVEAFVKPNLGANERWVPYHTILGVHELFLIRSVHTLSMLTEEQRFKAMFIFRAHCKRDLFKEVQLPIIQDKSFWTDPMKAFEPGGLMEEKILKYRIGTNNPLVTSSFRAIPRRILEDNDENLVRSITDRTKTLLEVAEHLFPILKDTRKSAPEKLSAMATWILRANGLGETWAKMLTVSIDLAYPEEGLLAKQCNVGSGAVSPLRCLLGVPNLPDKGVALEKLLDIVNKARSESVKQFWIALKEQETLIRKKFSELPLICTQVSTEDRRMSAATLQVQLCEYRQFRHSVARLKYGLVEDETMKK